MGSAVSSHCRRQLPHVSFGTERDVGRRGFYPKSAFSQHNHLTLRRSHTHVIKSAQLLWFSVCGDTGRWFCCPKRLSHLYWKRASERTLRVPKHSLPPKGFTHVNLTQWMVPLVRNPSNDWETGSRVPRRLLGLWQFPPPAPPWVFVADEMERGDLGVQISSPFSGFHSNCAFFAFQGWVT